MKLWYVIDKYKSGTKRGDRQIVVPGEDVLEAYMTAWKLLKLEDLDMVYRSNAIITRAKKLEKKFELLEEKEQRRLMRPHYNKPK